MSQENETKPPVGGEAKKKKRNALNTTAMYRALNDMSRLVYPATESSRPSVGLQIEPIGEEFRVYLYVNADGFDGPSNISGYGDVKETADGESIEAALNVLLECLREKLEEAKRQQLKAFDDVLGAHTGVVRAARQRKK